MLTFEVEDELKCTTWHDSVIEIWQVQRQLITYAMQVFAAWTKDSGDGLAP